jgi:hypothetical protein
MPIPRWLVIVSALAIHSPAAAEPQTDDVFLSAVEPCEGCKRIARKRYDDDLGKVEVLQRKTEHGLAVILRFGRSDDRYGGIVFEDSEDGHAGSSDTPVKVTAKLHRFAFEDRVAIGIMLTETLVHTNDDGETRWKRQIAVVCDPERASCRRLVGGGIYDGCVFTGWLESTPYPAMMYTCKSGMSLVP